MRQRVPVSLRESLQEIGEKVRSRAALLNYMRSIPRDQRRPDHYAFEERLVREQLNIENLTTRVVEAWSDGRLSVSTASDLLRALYATASG